MAEDPGTVKNGQKETKGASYYLDLFDKAPSEHTKTLMINEKLVPWIQSKGIHPVIQVILVN